MVKKRWFLGFKLGPSLLDEIEQLQLGRAENVGLETLPNDLAPDFDPCIIRAAADVLAGRIPKWPTGADCKSAGLRLRRFESFSYHHLSRRELSTKNIMFSMVSDVRDSSWSSDHQSPDCRTRDSRTPPRDPKVGSGCRQHSRTPRVGEPPKRWRWQITDGNGTRFQAPAHARTRYPAGVPGAGKWRAFSSCSICPLVVGE